MRTTKTVISLLIAAIAVGVATETVVAQGFGIPSIPVPTVPMTISGRIVKPNGDPLPGVQIAGMLQADAIGGIGPSFPVVKPFAGIPKSCFTDGATVTTDADGRFTYRISFLPDHQFHVRGDKCSTLRGSLTAANATVGPVLGQPLMQQYDFEKATGPLPTKVQLLHGNIDAAPKAPLGAPLQMKK